MEDEEFGEYTGFKKESDKHLRNDRKSARARGFVEREEYPGTETSTIFRSYPIYMEKKEE